MIKLRGLLTKGGISNLTKQKIVYVAALLVATGLVGSAGYSLAMGDGIRLPEFEPESTMTAAPVNMPAKEISQGMETSTLQEVAMPPDANFEAAIPASSMIPSENDTASVEIMPDNTSNTPNNTTAPVNTTPTTNSPTPPNNNTGNLTGSMPAMSMDQVMDMPMEQAMEMMNEMNTTMSLSEMPTMQQGMQEPLPQFNMTGSTTTNQTMQMSGI